MNQQQIQIKASDESLKKAKKIESDINNFFYEVFSQWNTKKDEIRNQLITVASAVIPIFLAINGENKISALMKWSIIFLGGSLVLGIISLIFEFAHKDVLYNSASVMKNIFSNYKKILEDIPYDADEKLNILLKDCDLLDKKSTLRKLEIYPVGFFGFQIIFFLGAFILMLISFYRYQ